MTATFTGRISLKCPDCDTHLINSTPHGERYRCHDCGLEMVRDTDSFQKFRLGEHVGDVAVHEVALHMTWRPLDYVQAV
jgi:tRNA(Ile2) C34 agmatinyltransferase TiaS